MLIHIAALNCATTTDCERHFERDAQRVWLKSQGSPKSRLAATKHCCQTSHKIHN